MDQNNETAAVTALIDTFVDGWNGADGSKLASAFAEDADFTAVNGLRARGRTLIGAGHDELLRTIFRGVTLASKVVSVRILAADIAVVEAELSYPGRAILPGVTRALAQYVAQRSAHGWEIAVFRNMIPFERPVAGPVEERVRADMASA
jgi:uncharacterized protein (TIGR02246 family)